MRRMSKHINVSGTRGFWPFFHFDFRYGKVILTLNTAHPFFQTVWQPLSQLARTAAAAQESDADGSVEVPTDIAQTSSAILVGLQSILLTLARTQSRLGSQDIEGEYKRMFETLNREWSENLATVLLA